MLLHALAFHPRQSIGTESTGPTNLSHASKNCIFSVVSCSCSQALLRPLNKCSWHVGKPKEINRRPKTTFWKQKQVVHSKNRRSFIQEQALLNGLPLCSIINYPSCFGLRFLIKNFHDLMFWTSSMPHICMLMQGSQLMLSHAWTWQLKFICPAWDVPAQSNMPLSSRIVVAPRSAHSNCCLTCDYAVRQRYDD